MSNYERYISDLCGYIAICKTMDRLASILSEEWCKRDAFFEEKKLPKWMRGVSADELNHILDGAIEKHLMRAKLEGDPMTMAR